MGVGQKRCDSLERKYGLPLDGGNDAIFLIPEGQSSLGNALLPPNMYLFENFAHFVVICSHLMAEAVH